jgi:serine/threonine protein kinase
VGSREEQQRSVNPQPVVPFGKYFLIRKLAEGGMAEVFLAKHVGAEAFERNVVIKRIRGTLSSQPEFIEMFLDEARLAAQLVHPNIIQIHDLGYEEDQPYICMEYLPGEDLATVLRAARQRQERMPIGVALRIAADAARGLHHAHEFTDETGQSIGIVHRDVSPANLYLTYEGQTKLLDFGIAKAESRVTVTGIGVVKGKFQYMSPEQGLAGEVDRRSDVFSLGVTLYEMLAGTRPFEGDSEQSVMSATRKGDFVALSKVRPETGSAIEEIVSHAMARSPRDRHNTALELAIELEEVMATATPAAGSVVASYLRHLFDDARVAERSRIPSLAKLSRSTDAEERRIDTSSATIVPPSGSARRSTKRRPSKRWRALVVAVGALLFAASGAWWWRNLPSVPPPPEGCGQVYGSHARDRILIGATMPLTLGNKADGGQNQLLSATLLALDEINQRDGVATRPFALSVCDNRGDLDRIKSQVRYLVEELKVPAVVTSWSAQTLLAMGITLPAGVLTITADATSPELRHVPDGLNGAPRLLWRTTPSDEIQSRVIADLLIHAPEWSSIERVGIVYMDDPYGQGLAVPMSLLLRRGAKEVHAFQYAYRGDITATVKQLAATHPQITVVVGFPYDMVRILNMAATVPELTRAAGHRWFFTDAGKEQSIFTVEHPDEIEGAHGTAPARPESDAYAAFSARFSARFHIDSGRTSPSPHSATTQPI